jgi:hypothetical protein
LGLGEILVRGKRDKNIVLNIVAILALCLTGTMASAQRKPMAVDLSTLPLDKLVGQAEAGDVPALSEIAARANNGDRVAQYVLGNLYHSGPPGLPRNDVAAVSWLQKSGHQGYSKAEVELGSWYENGIGVPRNFGTAAHWYHRAGDAGADFLSHLLVNHPELVPRPVYTPAPQESPAQVASAQSYQSAQAAQQQETVAGIKEQKEEIADKIRELQSDIEEHESAAETWNDTLQNLSDTSSCTGIGAALCQGIGQVGVAKAQANRNKELNAARADRAEISRLQGEAAELSQRLDESFAGNLQQVVSQSGTAPNTPSNPQSLAVQRQLGQKPDMSQELRNTSPTKGCWNGKSGAASGVILGSQTWSACPAY